MDFILYRVWLLNLDINLRLGAGLTKIARKFMWPDEDVLVLGDAVGYLHDLSVEIHSLGGDVSFHIAADIVKAYSIPLERYSMTLMYLGEGEHAESILEVGRMIRRADPSMKIVVVSQNFQFSSTPSTVKFSFSDALISLPTKAEHLALFFSSIE